MAWATINSSTLQNYLWFIRFFLLFFIFVFVGQLSSRFMKPPNFGCIFCQLRSCSYSYWFIISKTSAYSSL